MKLLNHFFLKSEKIRFLTESSSQKTILRLFTTLKQNPETKSSKVDITDSCLPKSPTLPQKMTLWGILALNTGTFFAWHNKERRYDNFLERNWNFSLPNFSNERYSTLITNNFCQYSFYHFYVNSIALYLSSYHIMNCIGIPGFLSVYFIGGIFSTTCHSIYTAYRKPLAYFEPFFGASDSVMSIATLYACIYPYHRFRWFVFFPINAIGIISAETLWDLRRNWDTNELHSWTYFDLGKPDLGHIPGTIFGVFTYFYLARRGKIPRGLENLFDRLRPPSITSKRQELS